MCPEGKAIDRWGPNCGVHISRVPRQIEFIRHNEDLIPRDLWGPALGYPWSKIHPFTHDGEAWAKEEKPRPPRENRQVA
jgi:hypothetical protein